MDTSKGLANSEDPATHHSKSVECHDARKNTSDISVFEEDVKRFLPVFSVPEMFARVGKHELSAGTGEANFLPPRPRTLHSKAWGFANSDPSALAYRVIRRLEVRAPGTILEV